MRIPQRAAGGHGNSAVVGVRVVRAQNRSAAPSSVSLLWVEVKAESHEWAAVHPGVHGGGLGDASGVAGLVEVGDDLAEYGASLGFVRDGGCDGGKVGVDPVFEMEGEVWIVFEVRVPAALCRKAA